MELSPGQVLNDRYRIVRLLGQGGMGAVYHAHDPVLNRAVAIKELQPDPITGEQAAEQVRQQFLREAQSLASLHHPNLPRVTDYFTQNRLQYLVMDYIEGQSLQELVLARHGGLDEDQVLEWADQLLSALDYIHQHNLIHRDIKPSNIRLTPDGRIFLVDFGLVKAYNADDPTTMSLFHGIGSPQYAPPEQYDAEHGHTDQRADLYALGATLYHLLTGQMPLTVTQRMSDPSAFRPPRAHSAKISPEVERVILRAMELERARRFASAADMRAALALARRTRSSEPNTTTRLEALPSPARTGRMSRLLVVIGVVIAIAIIVSLLASQATPAVKPTLTAVPQSKVTITLLSGTTTPEFIVIQNDGTAPQDLTGWYVESVVGPQTFNFPAGFILAPGANVRIESYTGAKNNPPQTLLWSTDAIWRNTGDKAILRNSAGVAISTKCYGDACP
jgi:serine/threonine-protein kinase